MPKIAMIGAGSIVFTQQFLNDLLQVEALQGVELCLMSPTLSKLEKIQAWGERVCQRNDFRAQIRITTDRKAALQDADYVINTMKIGGSVEVLDKDIPLRYVHKTQDQFALVYPLVLPADSAEESVHLFIFTDDAGDLLDYSFRFIDSYAGGKLHFYA